jgi:hypothetical protein
MVRRGTAAGRKVTSVTKRKTIARLDGAALGRGWRRE